MMRKKPLSDDAQNHEWELQERARTQSRGGLPPGDAATVAAYRQISDALRGESLPALPTNFASRVMAALAAERRRRRSLGAARNALIAGFMGYLALLGGGYYVLGGGVGAFAAVTQARAPEAWILLAVGLASVAAVLQGSVSVRSRAARGPSRSLA